MAKVLTPLAPNVPIVDKDGNPTPYFQRVLQELSDARVAASLIDALGGDPNADAVVTWDDTANDLAFVPKDALLALDELTDVDTSTTPPDDGQALIWDDANSEWIPGDVASGGGGGAPWEIIYANSALTNPTTSVDVDISAFQEVLVIGRAITCGTSGFRSVLVSTDGGSTYYNTNGDYVSNLNTGGEGSTFTAGNHETASTAARGCGVHICGPHLNGTSKLLRHINASGAHRIFAANTLPITNLRVCSLASSGAAINNLTGGSVYIIGRRIESLTGNMAEWSEIHHYDATVSGAIANRDVNVSGYSDLMVVLRGVTLASSGWRTVLMSTDGGSSYHNTSGNYVSIDSSGVASNEVFFFSHSSSSASARSATVYLNNLQNGRKVMAQTPARSAAIAVFEGSNLPITHIRIQGTTSSTSLVSTNMNAGTITVYGR